MEQKRPADIFQEFLDYLWNGLGLEEKGWKRLKKGDFKKKMKNGLTYQVWFDRSRYNYIDYEIGYGNVEVGFSCIIKQGDDYLYSFRIEPTTGGSFFRMLTEDLRLNTRLLDTFLPLIKAHYLDFIDRFEEDPAEALQPVCAPFIQPEDYSWCIHVREQMVERYGTAEQMEEYRRGADCVRRNPALVPALLGLTFCQLTALFSVPLVVYHAFGLTGSGALDIIGTQALVTLAVASLPLPGAVGASEGGFVAAMRLFFGAGLVTPAVLVSRGISFYSFLLLSGCVTLLVHLRTRNRQPVAVSPRLPKTARGTVVT